MYTAESTDVATPTRRQWARRWRSWRPARGRLSRRRTTTLPSSSRWVRVFEVVVVALGSVSGVLVVLVIIVMVVVMIVVVRAAPVPPLPTTCPRLPPSASHEPHSQLHGRALRRAHVAPRRLTTARTNPPCNRSDAAHPSVHTHTHAQTHTYAHTRTCTHTRTNTHTYTHTRTRAHAHTL